MGLEDKTGKKPDNSSVDSRKYPISPEPATRDENYELLRFKRKMGVDIYPDADMRDDW
jgi:hypothetical protein